MHKPLVCRTNSRVRPTNHQFVVCTAVCATQIISSSNEQPNKPPVRRAHGRVRCTNHQFFERTAVFGQQTTSSSCARPCAMHKPSVRRPCLANKPQVRCANGRVRYTNHLFASHTRPCGNHTVSSPSEQRRSRIGDRTCGRTGYLLIEAHQCDVTSDATVPTSNFIWRLNHRRCVRYYVTDTDT